MANPVKIIKTLLEVERQVGAYVISPGGNLFERWYKDRFKDRCDEYANLPTWARVLTRASGSSIARMCQPHWDEQGTDGPIAEPPFTGGQCDSRLYRVAFNIQRNDGQGGVFNNTVNRRIYGPIGNPSVSVAAAAVEITLTSRNVFNGGPCTTGLAIGDLGSKTFQSGLAGGNAGVVSATLTSFQIVEACGAGAECGDPPPILKPGPNPPTNPGPLPGPEPRDDPDGGPIPDFPIPPYPDPIYGPIPYEPDDGPGPGGGGEPQPPAGGDGLPGAPDSVGPPAGETGAGGEGEDFDFGPPPEGKVWVGVLIENTVDPRYGNIPGTGPQNTVYPYVIGNASLIYAGGFSSSSRMRSRWHEMFRPVTALQVTGARVQCRPGVSASVRPVSATICPENTCGDSNNG